MMVEQFRTYLLKHEYSTSTIDSYISAVEKFLNWCDRKGYEAESMTYNQWLGYLQLIKGKTKKTGHPLTDKSVAHTISIIRLYFDFLVFEDLMYLNPIQKKSYKVNSDFYHELLSKVELEELYYSYPTLDLKHPKCLSVAMRNKVIIGLVVFQGIDSTTLQRLTPEHFDLKNRKIHIPGTSRSNSRTLKLEDAQISVLRQYIQHDRAVLQKKVGSESEALIPLTSSRFSWVTSDICKKLKTINLKVTNLRQIRASVITLWVKKYDLRRTQLMAGHRFISSTEAYQPTDLESLEEATMRFHPLG